MEESLSSTPMQAMRRIDNMSPVEGDYSKDELLPEAEAHLRFKRSLQRRGRKKEIEVDTLVERLRKALLDYFDTWYKTVVISNKKTWK